MYRLKNISGSLIVCDLAIGNTLRLKVGEETVISDSEMTSHLFNQISGHTIKVTHFEDKTSLKNTVKKGE